MNEYKKSSLKFFKLSTHCLFLMGSSKKFSHTHTQNQNNLANYESGVGKEVELKPVIAIADLESIRTEISFSL